MSQPYASTNVPNNQTAVIAGAATIGGWVIGILGFCLGLFIPFIGLCTGVIFVIGNLVGAVAGYMARDQIKASQGAEGGMGLANIGFFGGIFGTIISLLLICLLIMSIFGLAFLGPDIGNVFSDIVDELSTPVP